jgi:uncharacterized membrane protein
MKDQIQSKIPNHDWESFFLQASLLIILIFILFLIPSFEAGPNLAAFSASLAIVVLSLLNSRSAEKQTKVLKRQKRLIERQNEMIETISDQANEQKELLDDLNQNINRIGLDNGGESDGDKDDCIKEPETSSDGSQS